MKFLFASTISAALFCGSVGFAQTAQELARRMDDAGQGSALIRTRLEVRSTDGARRVLQLQIKERRTKSATDIAYKVFWPNELKDQVILLHQEPGRAPSGSIIVPQQPVRALKASDMDKGLFDSDLSYQDAVENFFAWKSQTIAGSEAVSGVTCQVLESKPDNSSVSIYGKVRSWIDPQRLVPLRIEKYSSSGKLIRRIDITRVARDEKHNPIPANLTVQGTRPGTVTDFIGARIDQDVTFTDADFTPAAVLR